MITIRVHVQTEHGVVVTHDASLVMLTRAPSETGMGMGDLMLTFVANRITNVVPIERVVKMELVQ